MLPPLVQHRDWFRTRYPVKSAGARPDTDSAARTRRNPAVKRLCSHLRGNDACEWQVNYSGTRGKSGVELETEIYGVANSAVNVIVSAARPNCEPTGATLSSLASGGPPLVTVRV
jgi:hypothetical protein